MKALVWLAATYGCESWTLEKNEETRLDAFEMKGLRKILRISWTAKKTNECVLNKAGVKREQLDTVKARKLAYYGHTMRKQGSCPYIGATTEGTRRLVPCTSRTAYDRARGASTPVLGPKLWSSSTFQPWLRCTYGVAWIKR